MRRWRDWVRVWRGLEYTVSVGWLEDNDRRELARGTDGKPIRWPIKKTLNESSLWTRHQEAKRKRA